MSEQKRTDFHNGNITTGKAALFWIFMFWIAPVIVGFPLFYLFIRACCVIPYFGVIVLGVIFPLIIIWGIARGVKTIMHGHKSSYDRMTHGW